MMFHKDFILFFNSQHILNNYALMRNANLENYWDQHLWVFAMALFIWFFKFDQVCILAENLCSHLYKEVANNSLNPYVN